MERKLKNGFKIISASMPEGISHKEYALMGTREKINYKRMLRKKKDPNFRRRLNELSRYHYQKSKHKCAFNKCKKMVERRSKYCVKHAQFIRRRRRKE